MKKILILPAAIVMFAGPALAQNAAPQNNMGMRGTMSGGRTNDSNTDANQNNSGMANPMNNRNAMGSDVSDDTATNNNNSVQSSGAAAMMGNPANGVAPPGSVPTRGFSNGSLPTGSVPPVPMPR